MPSIDQQLFRNSPVLHVRDVTLRASDDAQSHREKLARIILNEMYQFVALLDGNGNILCINRAASEGAGIQLEDIQERPFWEARWWAVSKETQDLQRDCVRRAAAGEFVRCDVEIYGQANGEETIIIDFSLSPIRDQNGRIVFLLAEGRNITEKKQSEAEIARKNAELQRLLDKIRQLDQLKSDFFANVSHELRTPLSLILGPAESLLATGTNLTEIQRRDLGVIQRNATTLLKHVNDLLDVAKLDADKHTVNYARIDLAREVRTIAAHFDSLAPQRSISYVIVTPESLEAELDPAKFDRILLNLLSNAFKFTPPGGRIKCTLTADEPDRLLLTVQDSGPGVQPHMREEIFDRFRQAQSGTTREFGGTGLGLAIAKEFVHLHGGTITVSDAPGGGALFQVEMPRRAPPGSFVRVSETPSPSLADTVAVKGAVDELQSVEAVTNENVESAERPLVLVSEDNAEMRLFIKELLVGDYRVVEAADGAEALKKAIAQLPDLIVTDLMMPKLGGDRLVVELRSRESLAHMPVLVLSANADEEMRLKLLSESVQDYIIKPFSALELRARVRNLVMMKRTRDALQKELDTQDEDLSRLTQQLVVSRRDLQQSLHALQASEERWRAVFENSGVGLALTNPRGIFTETNRAFQEMVGYTHGELQAMSYIEITYEEDRQVNRALGTDLWEGKFNQFRHEKRYRRKTGDLIWVRNTVSLVTGTETVPQFAMAVVEDITERKRTEEELQESFEQLRALAARLQKVREEERTYVAREIHDELGQALTAIKIEFSSLIQELPAKRRPADKRSRSILKLVDGAIQSVRRIGTELRPGILDDLGVVAAVEWAAEEFQLRTGIECVLDLPADDIALDQERSTAIFRIFQETLTNVARHSGASRVFIRLARENGDIFLEVRDNGKGIEGEQINNSASLGILGIRERVLLLDGQVEITGSEREGTIVRVRIPESQLA